MENFKKKVAIIIGAGPAGLSAAYSLLTQTDDIIPIIIEKENIVGGISRTIDCDGIKTDIGPHRFFSKDKRVLDFWFSFLPLQGKASIDDILLKRDIDFSSGSSNPEKEELSMLKRRRFSRIFYLQKFFDYPVKMNLRTILNLGLLRTFACGMSYIKSCFFKRKEVTLEDFMTNRFGKVLYQMFFEHYTQKVWGRHPSKISKEWGEQRIKGLSLLKTVLNKFLPGKKNKETSLIEKYYYPKRGSGQLWQEIADKILERGGEIHLNTTVKELKLENNRIKSLIAETDGIENELECNYVISSMPVKDLISSIIEAPAVIKQVAEELPYRDYMLVSLLVKNWNLKNNTDWKTIDNICPDSWIYIQDRELKAGRIYIPKNFSPYMSNSIHDTLIGLEYFCNEGDELWRLTDEEMYDFAINELLKIKAIKDKSDVIKSYRKKIKKAYPAYFDSYKDFDKIKHYLDSIKNLYCIGRNGQHKYNNMDHSTLSGIIAAEIIKNNSTKDVLWEVNTEESYQETTSN